MQRLALVALFGLSLLLSACGGGGGGGSATTTAAPTSNTAGSTNTTTSGTSGSGSTSGTTGSGSTSGTTGSGSTSGTTGSGSTSGTTGSGSTSGTTGSGSTSGTTTQTAVANQVPVAMASAPGDVNVPVVSVTVCAPGTSTCQTIPDIIVDTGSSGLRVAASALNATMKAALPAESSQTTSGQVAECATFGIGVTWGGVHKADIKLAGELASAVPVQVVGDSTVPAAPSACSGSSALGGANGLIGISVFKQDCGAYCVQTQANNVYYACSTTSCTSQATALSQQVANPVASFTQDNNGTMLTMPSVPAAGSASANGVLSFGIATQSDNTPSGSMQFYSLDPSTGYFKTAYKGQTLNSFLDTGSNMLYFADSSIAQCSQPAGLYCPSSPLSLSAQITAFSGTTASTIGFTLQNGQQAYNANPSALAIPGIGADPATGSFLSTMFDWGFPFYFGRTVGTLIEGAPSPYGVGPGTLF